MPSLKERIMAGIRAFREPALITDTLDEKEFSDYEARRLRYSLLWSFFENTAYRNLHTWAPRFKVEYGLYKYTRNIYNPSYRLGEFYKTHLLGGALDPLAGDGKETPSALPIVTKNEALRPAIAQLWRDSNWFQQKDIYGMWGATMGDVALRVIDDMERGEVYLKVVHAGTIKSFTADERGNCKGYELEEKRQDPRKNKRAGDMVTYGENCEREDDSEYITFRTTLNGQPYPWFDAEEWSEPYGFVPFVLTQHNNVGLGWGWSELYPCLSKVREIDDVASKTSDQIRKMVDAPWLLAGVTDPATRKATQPKTTGATATAANPQPGREEVPILYADAGATATPLVAPLDLAATLTHIANIMQELEREYPELQMDIWTASGESSGRALRTARQRTTTKVLSRRAGYDGSIVKAHQMAVAIGGMRGYEGYQGFGLDSYAAGKLEHSIGERPVFEPDPLDKIEEDQAFWEAANAAKNAGVPLVVYLRRNGWDDKAIAEIQDSEEYKAKIALMSIGFGNSDNGTGNNRPPNNNGRSGQENREGQQQ